MENIGQKKTVLDKESLEIIDQNRKFIFPNISATLHTENEDIAIPFISMLRVSRNFNNNISDIIYIEFLVGLGTARDIIYNNKDKLEISLYSSYDNKVIRNFRYKLLLLNEFPKSYLSDHYKYNSDDLDRQELSTIRAQCVDPLVLKLKHKYISGIFHNLTMKDFIRSVLNYELSDIKVLGRDFEKMIHVYEPDNNKKYFNIVVKSHNESSYTKLIKLPYLLQDTYGIYKNGINIYFTNIGYGGVYKKIPDKGTNIPKFLFNKTLKYNIEVFPLYDFDRYEKETKKPKLLLINPSIGDIGLNENDFYYKDGVFKLIVNNIEFTDAYKSDRYTIGTSIAITDPNKMFKEDILNVNDTDIGIDNTFTNIEDIDNDISSYKSIFSTNTDANIYRYYSLINRNKGIIGNILISKINPDFIYPGMPFKYMFTIDKQIKETTGVIQAVEYYYDIPNKTIVTAISAVFKRLT